MKTIPDNHVRNIWVDPVNKSGVVITPDWYTQNGLPINNNGDDLEYSHTQIDLREISEQLQNGIVAFLNGLPQSVIDGACELVVKNLND